MHGEYLIEIIVYLQSVRQVGLTVTFSQTYYRVLWAVKSSNFSPFSTSPVSVTAEQGPIQPDQGFRAILSYPLIGLETEGGSLGTAKGIQDRIRRQSLAWGCATCICNP